VSLVNTPQFYETISCFIIYSIPWFCLSFSAFFTSKTQYTYATHHKQAYKTVVVFCDISGFTKLSEFMARSGKGAEGVSRNLNKYFQMMVKIISSGGGDVLKFAGDAMIVLWPEDEADSIETRLQRATQCAVFIQQQLDQAILEDSVQLSVKIGIGVGMVSVIHIGGTHKRMEYLAVGDPLIQAFHAEHHAVPGQVNLLKLSCSSFHFVQ
jgi:class 3 adenylate cyclase